MSKKRQALQPTINQLRTTFNVLRNQLRLADSTIRLRAIHEFDRELTQLYHEEVDKLAQANGLTYGEQMHRINEEAKSWTAAPPSA